MVTVMNDLPPLWSMSIDPPILRYSYFIWSHYLIQLFYLKSLSDRSLHLTLVTKWSRSWMTSHPFDQCQLTLPFWDTAISKLKSLVKDMRVVKGQGHISCKKFKGQGHGQTRWSHLRPRNQSICLIFVSWQSDHFWLRYSKFHIWPWKFKVKVMAKVKPDSHIWGFGFNRCLLFVSWQSDHFWLRYSKFHIWPWKFKVKVMAKVKPDGLNWGLEFNWYVCFSFHGNQTIFGWDIANSIFDLENSRSRSRQKSTKSIDQVIYRSGPTIVPKMKEIQKVVQKLLCEQKSAAGATNQDKNIKSPLVYWGDSINHHQFK